MREVTDEMVRAAREHIFHYSACRDARCKALVSCECAVEVRNALRAALAAMPGEWNNALEAACGALAAVAIQTNRPECCEDGRQWTENEPPSCCGNPNLLVIASEVAEAIRNLRRPA